MINWELLIETLPDLCRGVIINLEITVVGLALGFVGGVPIAFGEASPNRGIRAVAITYCTLIRGTPMMVQILCVFYLLPQAGVVLPPLVAVMLTVGANSAAYMAQIIRAGLEAIPKTQKEAAYALGLSPIQTYRYVIFPQWVRTMLPALGNEGISLLKDSSLASVVGVMEIVKVGAVIRGRTFETFTVFLGMALVFLVLSIGISVFIKFLEKRGQVPCSL